VNLLQDLFSVCKTFGVSAGWVLGLSDDRGGQQQGLKSQ
jgi:hypothetical protein